MAKLCFFQPRVQAITAFRSKPKNCNNTMLTVSNNVDKPLRRKSSADLSDELGATLKTNSTVNIPLSSISSNVSTAKLDPSSSIGGDTSNKTLKDTNKNLMQENGCSLHKKSIFYTKSQSQVHDSPLRNENSESSLSSALDQPTAIRHPNIGYVKYK